MSRCSISRSSSGGATASTLRLGAAFVDFRSSRAMPLSSPLRRYAPQADLSRIALARILAHRRPRSAPAPTAPAQCAAGPATSRSSSASHPPAASLAPAFLDLVQPRSRCRLQRLERRPSSPPRSHARLRSRRRVHLRLDCHGFSFGRFASVSHRLRSAAFGKNRKARLPGAPTVVSTLFEPALAVSSVRGTRPATLALFNRYF